MRHATVSQIKASLQNIWHKKYLSFANRKRCEVLSTVFCSVIGVSAILILFIMGGSIYGEEHTKELTYSQSVCQVYNTSYREYWCIGRGSKTRCYAPVWYIAYRENQTMNATIVGYNRFRSLSDTIKKMNEYQVSYFKFLFSKKKSVDATIFFMI